MRQAAGELVAAPHSLRTKRFRAVSERESKTVRKLAVAPFLARPKPKIPFLGLSFLQNQTETLATQASDTWQRQIASCVLENFCENLCLCNRILSPQQVAQIRSDLIICDMLRRQRFCGVGRNMSSSVNACVGGYVLLIPLELIRNNRDWLCQKGTRGPPHRQSYDIRTPGYK